MLEGVLHIVLMNEILKWDTISETALAVSVATLGGSPCTQASVQASRHASPPPRACCSPGNFILLRAEHLKAQLFVNSPHQTAVLHGARLISMQAVKYAGAPDLSY